MCEIGLNGKDVCQVSVIIFRPEMLVVHGIDQLHVYTHAIADPADTAFQDSSDAQGLADFAGARVYYRTGTT